MCGMTRRRIVSLVIGVALVAAACSGETEEGAPAPASPEIVDVANEWWAEDLSVVDQSNVCVLVAQLGGGFELLTEASSDDGEIEMFTEASIEDTLPNRVALGAEIDRVVAANCP